MRLFSDTTKALSALGSQPAAFWQSQGEFQALQTFHEAAERVPAYKHFLKKHNVDHSRIHTIQDFQSFVPITTKDSYIRQYSLSELSWDGQLASGSIISYSSGTSGAPSMWARFVEQEEHSVLLHDIMLRGLYDIHEKKTLMVVCFSFGIHIAGMITAQSIAGMLSKQYPFSMVTPGKNLEDVVAIVQQLHPQYEQIIFFGHPGFIKQVVDELSRHGFDWSAHSIRLILSGGGFFEEWRSYMLAAIGETNPVSVIGLYGCTDMGFLAHETPASIAYKKQHSDTVDSFVFQYIPGFRFIETVRDELVFTANAGMPTIRYNIHDRGSVIEWSQECDSSARMWRLPFVHLYGRQGTVVLNGANIYSENIQKILEHPVLLSGVTGRFVHEVVYNDTYNEEFVIHIEMKQGMRISENAVQRVQHHFFSALQTMNAEYADCVRALGMKMAPVVRFYEHGHHVFDRSTVAKKRL